MRHNQSYSRYRLLLLFAVILLTVGGSALAASLVNSTPRAPATLLAQTNPVELPPVLLATNPAAGTSWNGAAVTFTFDQPMAEAGADSLTVEPALSGVTTVADATVTFTPEDGVEPGTRYRFQIDGDAPSAAGVALGNPVELILTAATPLQVTSTQPSHEAQEVSTDSQIIVIFNRPVVPLTGVDEQADLPQPLTIDPPVEGTGQWLNTSVYTFQPTLGLAGATTYNVTVDDLTGLSGETLAEPVTFSFTTAAPIVIDAQTSDEPIQADPASALASQIRPDTAIRVTFSQPMDPESTAAALRIVKTEGDGTPVAGEIVWDTLQKTLTFTPTTGLEFGASYTLRVETDAQPASRQGNLREPFERVFNVVPLPAILNTVPEDGATDLPPSVDVRIRFSAPVSPALVLANLHISPLPTTTQVYSYYSDYNGEAVLSWAKEPQTQYTVTIGGAIADAYGNTLGEDQSFRFTTGDYAPYARINLDRFTHFSAYTPTLVSVYYRNIEQVDVTLYQVAPEELFRLTGPDQYQVWEQYQMPNADAARIWSRSYATTAATNITGRKVISMTDEAGNNLPPGAYLLELNLPADETLDTNASQPRQTLIVLSNYNMVLKKGQEGESLAWLTDLRTGEPVTDKAVRFYDNGTQVAEVTTNADGIATSALPLNVNMPYAPILAIAGEPGAADFAAVSSEWSNGIASWDFGVNSGYNPQQYQLYFYTDRPIYRPGQTVYWKGIVRLLENDQYSIPAIDTPVQVIVRDDRGNIIQQSELTLSDQGTLHGEVVLSSEAVTGYYIVEATLPTGGEQPVIGNVGFQVAAYSKPEFQITVTAEQPEYNQGDTARFTLQANYFSGEALANAPLTWYLIANPYNFTWADAPLNRYFSFTPYDPTQEEYNPYLTNFMGLIQEGRGTTDANGRFVLELPADLGEALQSQLWTFSATVQSFTNQYVGGQANAIIHRGDFYIGLSPQSYVVAMGEESTVDLVTVTPQGEAYPDAELEVVVYEFQWNSLYMRAADGSYNWQTSVLRTPVLTTTATTDDEGHALITWTPEKGGQYQIAARGEDDAGNAISSAAYVWVSTRDAGDFVAWPRENNDRIELVADKPLYAPGDTAKILVPSPFTGPVEALVTLERGGVIESRIVTFTGNSETLEIPITADHIPNIFVSVIIVKGVDESNPFPSIRVGLVQLAVDTSEKELNINIAPSASAVAPGATISYTLTVTDHTGAPVSNAEVSVALVDKAVLTLAFGDTRTLLDVFYYQRPLGVTTGALLVINQDRLSQQLSEGAKGGGGGGDGGLELREDFPDIAYWRADLTTDETGQINFAVELPDNLTTWVLVAKGITADTLVGEANNEIVASKELQVRPLLPRFFTAGDQAQIGALVINTTDAELDDLAVTIDIAGAQSDMRGIATFTSTLAAGGQEQFDLPINVDALADHVTITFTATSATLNDAIRMTLPVVRYETPETVGSAGSVPSTGQLEAVRVPADATDNGALTITLEPSLAAGMIEGLDYLAHYPYECNEQTVSRFLPNLFTVRALRALNIEDAALETSLAAQVEIGVQRLANRQNPDGGWGFWSGEASNTFITSYVLWGLANAQTLDFIVPERTISEAVNYLNNNFAAPKDIEETWRLNEMAFTLFVLSETQNGDSGRTSTLFDVRERLDHYGRAYLAMALANLAETNATPDARVDTLLDDLFSSAQVSATGAAWHEAQIDYHNMNTDTRTTSIVLAAFVRLDPTQPLLENVVRWLMSARQAGRWETTQENAWAIIALTDWMAATGELEADYDWSVTLNEETLGSGAVNADNLTEPVQLRAAVSDLLRDTANAIQLSRSNDSGQLYYTTHLRYYLDALAVEPRDRGIVVDRRFVLAGETVNSATVGDVISVTVTIVAPTDLHHVLIEAPIPAGTEPIDPNLATTPSMYAPAEIVSQENNPQNSWMSWLPTNTDIRDEKVALFATYLPAGAYEYTFQVRASVPGEYRVLPAHGEMMYFPEVWGRSGGALFTVEE